MDDSQKRLQNMVEAIAKDCDGLTEDSRPYDDYEEDEKKAYDNDEPGAKGVGAYLEDAYDWMYYINRNGKLEGVKILVAFGGPTVYVNTYTGEVTGSWGASEAKAELSNDACDVINDYFEEVYECTKNN